jgi:hypothetical protein
MKQPEYIEGTEALENFEQLATAILRAPKPNIKAKQKAPTSRKPGIRRDGSLRSYFPGLWEAAPLRLTSRPMGIRARNSQGFNIVTVISR